MIFDRSENLSRYMNRDDARRIYEFVSSVNRETPTGRHEIDGDRLFAFVSEYPTKTRSDAVLEAHNQYLDLHFLVYGEEKQEFYYRPEMTESVPYNSECEAALYCFPERKNELILRPGFFSLYFTDDAHAPQLAVGEPETVRKIVVKASAAVFENESL